MNLMRRPFWIVGFKIFTTVLYFLIIVPIVFLLIFVPAAAAMSPLAIYAFDWIPLVGAALGSVYLAWRFRPRRKGAR